MRLTVIFPRKHAEDIIRDGIRIAAENNPVPPGDWEPDVDSLVMITIAIRIEEEFDIELPLDCMPPGGFDSVDHCVEVFVHHCADLWKEPQKETIREMS